MEVEDTAAAAEEEGTEAAEDTIKEATEEEAIMTGRVAAAVDMVEEIVTRAADTKSYMVSWRRYCFEVCSYSCVRRRRGVVPMVPEDVIF